MQDPIQPGRAQDAGAPAQAGGGGLVGFATRRRVTVAMVTLTFVLFGLIALRDLKVNLLPDLSYPTLTVRTVYTGAAPAEIETLVSQPVEEAVGVVKNLRRLRSVSRTGQSDVVLQFAWGTDMDQAGLEVRDKLEVLRLPLEAQPPVLLRFDPSTEPIMRLVLSAGAGAGDGASALRALNLLRRHADDELKKKLEPVAGVAAVKVSGGLEDEIQVDIDQQRLAQLGIPVGTVVSRLQQENVNISGGRLEEGSQRYLVRTVNQFADVAEIRDLFIANVGAVRGAGGAGGDPAGTPAADADGPAAGTPVYLRDVAEVRQGHKEREAIIRLGGQEAVELAVYKEGDANTVAVADAVKARLRQLEKELPPDMTLTTIDDQSVFIRNSIRQVRNAALEGGLLAILVIFLFLRNARSTMVIALSLPVSIVATFFFMGQMGLSLNVMSLGGLALATGLVVDDSIVVLEAIAKARERGLGVLEAAISGTREVGMAVVASTLTTIAVFLPLVFVEGIAGQLFRDQALTVSIAIAISLVVAMTLVPMLASLQGRPPLAFPEEPPHPRWQPARRWQRPVAAGWRGIGAALRGLFFGVAWLSVRAARVLVRLVAPAMRRASDLAMGPYHRAERAYLRLLPAAIERPGRVLAGAALAFFLALLAVPLLGTDLIPQLAQDRFEMTVKLPAGTPLRETDALVRDIQRRHADDGSIRALYGVSGSGTRLDANPTESGENIGKLTVVMAAGGDGDDEAAITERLRAGMQAHPQATVDFSRPELFSFSTPLEIELRGQDLDAIEGAGRRLAALLRGDERFVDVESTVEEGFPEVQIRFDQQRAAALGLTTRQIADLVVRKVRGEVATRYSFRDRKIDVLVRARESDRASVDDIRKLIVNPASSRPVTLDSVAEVVATTGPGEIHRVDQMRVAVVSANLRGIDLGGAVREVRRMVERDTAEGAGLGAGVRMHVGGQGEELAESVASLLFAFALAVFLVYLVMASQFESLLHPFVILFTIPLAIVGAVAMLLATGSPVSVVVFIGLILLVGLVTKNAIILVDKVNQLREAGLPRRQALVEGAHARLRPIAMTTLCTIFGFLPLVLLGGEGAEVRAPMALTVIGGLVTSTLLTLLVIPVVYDLLDRRPDPWYLERGQRARRRFGRDDAGDAAVEPA
jgi:hydrophobic/amphiphilic exporter-1 (mainly G- bacteria), HAE1 family